MKLVLHIAELQVALKNQQREGDICQLRQVPGRKKLYVKQQSATPSKVIN